MKTSLGYPDFAASVRVARRRRDPRPLRCRRLRSSPPRSSPVWPTLADAVHVDEAILGYVSHLAEATRRTPHCVWACRCVAALAFVRCAKTWAASQGRLAVVPDDIKTLAHPVLCHRLLLEAEAQFSGTTIDGVIDEILAAVAPPELRRSA
jgi:MoxR-like ATPase